MESEPKVAPYDTSNKNSFAYKSAVERWPIIITGAIDDVHRSTGKAKDPDVQREGKQIVEALAKLKYELQHNRQLTPLPDDGKPDIKGYNEELEKLGSTQWHNAPWLFAECYLYRRAATLFALSTTWKSYDIFSRQKISTFKSSRPAVVELASRYKDIITQFGDKQSQSSRSAEEADHAEEVLFTEMCEICLWGNATDLSLLTNLSYDDIQKLQGSAARKAAEKNILVNDLPAAFARLKKSKSESPKGSDRRVDIVLDNAGFELYVDLILAGYLLASGLATHVVLHPKSIPWFVSDVLPTDFAALLNALADPQAFYTGPSEEPSSEESDSTTTKPLTAAEESNLKFLFSNWASLHADGRLSIRPNGFWTHGGSFWRLPTSAPELLADLRESELVVFKGDLNYRKLTADVMWPATTSFKEAIGPLGEEGRGIRVLALRTCKADVVVGLPEGRDQELRGVEETEKRLWAWSGKWAVVQYLDGR